jgi:RNA polymerase sigma factor (sigma-70 family)
VHQDPEPALEERFQQLLDAYAPALHRLCATHRREPADRHDLFQEIAVALWTALPRFRGEASERTWLYRIAHNTALSDFARKRRKRGHEVPIEDSPPAAPPNSRRQDLMDAVRRLDPVDRQLATLYLEGLTAREIGEVIGISEGNAAVRLSRLRSRLMEMLNPKEAQA